MKLPPQVWTSMYLCIPRRGAQVPHHTSLQKLILLGNDIWMVYDCFMHVISLQHSSCSAWRLLAWRVSQARRDDSDLECLLIFSVFGDRKSTNTGMGPAKVPQPDVDLINMTAPARWSLARAVGTPEFVAMNKARKEWHPPQKVCCPANVEGQDRRGFTQLSNSVTVTSLRGPRGMKAKILKSAEENQVYINV